MRRLVALFVLLLALVLVGCSSSPALTSGETPSAITTVSTSGNGAQIALLILDEQMETPMGQMVWSTITRFTGEEGVTSGQYKTTLEEAVPTLDLAVKGDAQVVVMLGDVMQGVLQQAQMMYPNIKFVIVDATTEQQLQPNSVAIRFAAEQVGWLAGYSTAYEGIAKVAFLEGDDAATQRYALGFLLGAEAALQSGATASRMEARPVYTSVESDQNWQARLAELFMTGTEMIFANAPGLQNEATLLALQAGANAISTEPAALPKASVLTVVQKNPQDFLLTQLFAWKAGDFAGGREVVAGVENGGVSLAMEGAAFQQFTAAQYDVAVKLFSGGQLAKEIEDTIQPDEAGALPPVGSLTFTHVVVLFPFNQNPVSQSTSASQSVS